MSPCLYGIKNSNRDFSNADTWGKNQFNSSFPASLVCYMDSKKLDLNYIAIKKGESVVSSITAKELYTYQQRMMIYIFRLKRNIRHFRSM